MIKFECGNCSHKISAPDKYAGKRVRCPKCKGEIRVPGPAGKTDARDEGIIKFRCPSCNQKIGVTADYAGRRVRCSKCKQPLQVPEAGEQHGPEQRELIKYHCPNCSQKLGVPVDYAGKKVRCTSCKQVSVVPQPEQLKRQPAASEAASDDMLEGDFGGGDMFSSDAFTDQLLTAEASAPAVERTVDRGPLDFEDGGELAGRAGALSPPQKSGGGTGSRKKLTLIFVGVGVILVFILVAVVWNLVSSPVADESKSKTPAKVDYNDALEFAGQYIGVLEQGNIDEAMEYLSDDLQADAPGEKLEKLIGQINKGEIVELDSVMKHFEQLPDSNQFLLSYNLFYADDSQSLIISIQERNQQFSINGIAVSQFFGETVSVGPKSYQEMSETIWASAELDGFDLLFGVSPCVIFLVFLFLVIIHIVATWVIFEKAGQPGWAAIVPFYNMWVLAEVADKPGWMGLLACFAGGIPIIGFIIQLYLWITISIGVAETFDKGILFGIGLFLLPYIFYPILAFSS